jgi:hypothetical protein
LFPENVRNNSLLVIKVGRSVSALVDLSMLKAVLIPKRKTQCIPFFAVVRIARAELNEIAPL